MSFEEGVVHVRGQLGRDGLWTPLAKTAAALREVVLMPGLAGLLRERRERAFARGHATPESFIFASRVGTPLHYRNIARRGLDPAMEAAGLVGEGRPASAGTI